MAQVGMRMPPGGMLQQGTSGAPPPPLHISAPRGSASTPQGPPMHMRGSGSTGAPPMHMRGSGSGGAPPMHMRSQQQHMIQNSGGAPHILRRMPMPINHSHQNVQGVGGHSHGNLPPSSNHVMMNQYGPPPPPQSTGGGVIVTSPPHSLPPTGGGGATHHHHIVHHPPVHDAGSTGAGGGGGGSRVGYHRQQTQPPPHRGASAGNNGGVTSCPPPPPSHQYTRPPPPLVVGHKSAANGSGAAVVVPATLNPQVCVSAKQKNKEIKEKTPMCLVNELARYNKIEHHYKLTDETGPAHKKSFTVCLKIGDKEEYIASGASIKKAQHAAAAIALEKTQFKHPAPKTKNTDSKMVTPTVELNGLAMKLGEVPVYSVVRKPTQNGGNKSGQITAYVGKLKVGVQEFTAEGTTEKAAKHNVATVALEQLKLKPGNPGESKVELDPTSSPFVPGATEHDDLKSPISLVHEMALKRNLQVEFTVVQESGQPHMRMFITKCAVANFLTKGEGNSKKSSKKAAAELMLSNLKKMPPVVSAIPPKQKNNTTKKKSKNLIKAETSESSDTKQSINPISRLIQIQQAKKEKEPVYTMIDERGLPRRREFFIKVTVGQLSAVGSGPNKKVAKRAAAENFLQQTGYSRPSAVPTKSALKSSAGDTSDSSKKLTFEDEVVQGSGAGGSGGRQVVPGILYLDDKSKKSKKVTNGHSSPSEPAKSSQNKAATIAKELLDGGTSPTAEQLAAASATACNGSGLPQPPVPQLPTSGQGVSSKEQLAYLSQILGFTVTYNHFPKKGEYLTLVSLSTTPPQVSHGTGASLETSHNNAAHTALNTLAANGLDNIQNKEGAPPPPPTSSTASASPPQQKTKLSTSD